MIRRIGLGFATVLLAGALAAGCGDDGKTIVVGGNSDIQNTDDFGASSIASNNLAPDGGALSPDGASVNFFRVIFNEDDASSDGASVADCSAVVLFSLDDGRTFVTHYDGSTITPPVELDARDHDSTVAFYIPAACVSFGQTSGYENSVATPDVVERVRRNHGFISLVMSGQTSLQDPTLNITKTGGANRGVHTGLFAWLWNPAFRSLAQVRASATTNPVGSITDTTSPYYNGVTSEFRYGWQHNAGDELSLAVAANVVPAVSGGIDAGAMGQSAEDSPSADVVGFGLVTDGNQRQQVHLGAQLVATTFNTRAQTLPSGLSQPNANFISPGEAVSVLGCVFTQIVTSLDQGTTNTGAFLGGSTVAAFVAPFNLATLTYETVQRITPPTGSANRNVAYATSFASYNNLAFLRYTEYTPDFDAVGFDPYAISGQETLLQKVALRQTATGSASVGSNQDLATRTTTAGLHRQFDPASTVQQEQELQDFGGGGVANGSAEAGLVNAVIFKSGVVYGRDEGLAETVIFFGSNDGTRGGGQEDGGSTGSTGNQDRALYAALLTQLDYTANGGTGSTDGDLVSGTTNPLLASRHRNADDVTTSVGGEFLDPVEADATVMNRAGNSVLAFYVQREGSTSTTTLVRRRTLKVVAYQPVRFGEANVPFTSRFSTTPFEVSDPLTGAGTGTTFDNGRGVNDREPNLPVNAYKWQGGIEYRCGFQSDSDVRWVLWEQSDGTEDRLFARALAVTRSASGPTISSTNVSVEFEEQASEQVVSDAANTVPATPGLERSQFNFLNGDLDSVGFVGGGTSDTTVGAPTVPRVGFNTVFASGFAEVVQSCDLGAAGAQAGASRGRLFLIYRKFVDATRPAILGNVASLADGDGFDVSILANAVLLGGTNDLGRARVDNDFNEDDLSPTAFQTTGSFVLYMQPAGVKTAALDATTQPNLMYLFFTEPTQSNTSLGADGLFVRTFDAARLFRAGTSTGAATDFQASFFPSAAPASFAAPTRLDHLTGGDVDQVISQDIFSLRGAVFTAGDSVGLVWSEDAHDWASGSVDGRTFPTSGGAPAPVLVDQDRSTDALFSTMTGCRNGSGDFVNAIYLVAKADNDPTATPPDDFRLHMRGAKTRLP